MIYVTALSTWSVYVSSAALEANDIAVMPPSVVLSLSTYDKIAAKLESGLHILHGRLAEPRTSSLLLKSQVKAVEICLNRVIESRLAFKYPING